MQDFLGNNNIFNVVRMGEHVCRLYVRYPVLLLQQGQVAGLGGRVAAHIYDLLRSRFHQNLQHILMHPGPRGIQHHHIGITL